MERRIERQSNRIGDLQQRGLDDLRKGKEVTIRDKEITRLKKEIYDERKRNLTCARTSTVSSRSACWSSAGTNRQSRSSRASAKTP